MSTLETAKSYVKRGWSPVPIAYKVKEPVQEGWQRLIINETNGDSFFGAVAEDRCKLLPPPESSLSPACGSSAGKFITPTNPKDETILNA
jgi:hypothetical protein